MKIKGGGNMLKEVNRLYIFFIFYEILLKDYESDRLKTKRGSTQAFFLLSHKEKILKNSLKKVLDKNSSIV